MTNARGDQSTLMSRFQTAGIDTFKTAEPAGVGQFRVLPFYTYDVASQEQTSEDNAISGQGGNAFPGEVLAGLRSITGSMVVPLGIQSFGWHLAALFGDPTTTDDTGGDYTHVFEAGAIQTPRHLTNGLTMNDVGLHFESIGVTPSQLQITAQKSGERSRATLQVIGFDDQKRVATIDTAPVVYDPDEVPVGFQGKVYRAGVAVGDVTQFDATVSSGIEVDQDIINCSPSPEDVILGRWSINGTITTRVQDAAWYDLGAAGSLVDLELEWLIAANKSHRLRLHNARLQRQGIAIGTDGVLSQAYQFTVSQPAAADTPFRWTIKNQTADYGNPT